MAKVLTLTATEVVALPPNGPPCSLNAQGQLVNTLGGVLARRRFQKGQISLREVKDAETGRVDKERSVWMGRWREDEIRGTAVHRALRNQTLGTLKEFPTKCLAQRELARRVKEAGVNSERYRPKRAATFSQFADRWEAAGLVGMKPSTQLNFKCHVRKYLKPYFGAMPLKEINSETVQGFVAELTMSPRTVRNVVITFRSAWKTARAWNYVEHDPFHGVRLPRRQRPQCFCFTIEEARRMLETAKEPFKTFCWLLAETGMRVGELCGMKIGDLDLDGGIIRISRSAWRGKLGEPKTASSIRSFALSPHLTEHLKSWIPKWWRPNANGILFAAKTGSPWDAQGIRKRKLKPLFEELGIKVPRGAGFHGFRHLNATLMDQLNAPMKTRQQRLGHSDSKITLDVYTHATSEDDKRVAEEMGGILNRNLNRNGENESGLEGASSKPRVIN